MSKNSIASVRSLVDKYFSLQWCRENFVVPISLAPSLPPNSTIINIAVANIEYLGTIGKTIKSRLSDAGFEVRYVEKNHDEIKLLLDQASEERLIEGDNIDLAEFTEEAVINALQLNNDDEINNSEFEIEFDDFEEDEIEEEEEDLSTEMLSSPIQKAAGIILISNARNGVSDIHIEPREKTCKIRIRKDGVMQNYLSFPKKVGRQVLACLKNMAKMDVAERRAAQDGKILRRFENQKLEFRCSTSNGKYGEGMVLRILNSDSSILDLDKLIYIESVRNDFRKTIKSANGIVIVSGPTGSGKSTTLASALQEKDNGELKIITAEDPIEYDMGGDIVQHQVNRAKKQTFSNLLRTFLRQDPDVILIGETRDPETAESSMDAAETGHLVFTTLHANTSSSSLTRLLDMNVPKYKLNASVRAILAQRLLRKVCPDCSTVRPISEKEANKLKIRVGTPARYANSLTSSEKEIRRKEKSLCLRCNGTGYNGRVGTYELLILKRNIQAHIIENKSTQEIEELARENGMLTLFEYGAKLVEDQITTVSELLRICKNEEQ
tara:strand:- start:9260 stop:10915 length:1656 start_codon:yes stop_codon:yes gene_type:complete